MYNVETILPQMTCR